MVRVVMRPPAAVLWLVFAALLAISGLLFLKACALTWPRWLATSFCLAGLDDTVLRREIERGDALKEHIAVLEQRLLGLPQCPAEGSSATSPRAPTPAAGAKDEWLKINPGTADLGALEGCWVSTSGTTINSRTGLKSTIVYCFVPGGLTGRVEIRQEDGTVCTGSINTAVGGNTLTMDEEVAPCSDGSKYVAAKITCRLKPSGPAECDLVDYPDGPNGTPEPSDQQVRDTEFRRYHE